MMPLPGEINRSRRNQAPVCHQSGYVKHSEIIQQLADPDHLKSEHRPQDGPVEPGI